MLPLSVLHAFGNLWGYFQYKLPNRARETTRKNLRLCFPEKTDAERDLLLKRSLRHTAYTGFEMAKAWMLPIEKTIALVKDTEGLDEFKKAASSGDGVILLAPHLGNWEIFGFHISEDLPSTFLYQPPKIPAFDKLLKQVRARSGVKLGPTSRKGVSLLLKGLKEGELIGVLPDQVPTDEGGIYAPFFGEKALSMTLISKLLKRTSARVFCGYAERLPNSRGFRVRIKEADAAIYSDDLEESVTALNRTVESSVNQAMEQYQWEYKRFRRRPDGQNIYKE